MIDVINLGSLHNNFKFKVHKKANTKCVRSKNVHVFFFIVPDEEYCAWSRFAAVGRELPLFPTQQCGYTIGSPLIPSI